MTVIFEQTNIVRAIIHEAAMTGEGGDLTLFIEALEHIQVAIHEHGSGDAPVIQSITNPTVGTPDTVNVGDMVAINGLNIAIAGDTPDVGVFFTPTSGGADVHIAAGKFSPNTPCHVQFILPAAVSVGAWTVRLATRTSRDVRSYTYETPVQVV
jgi:hypothetical protein